MEFWGGFLLNWIVKNDFCVYKLMYKVWRIMYLLYNRFNGVFFVK